MATQGNYNPNVRDAMMRQLNSLLRGEISAAEAYRMAISRIAGSDNTDLSANLDLLREMEEDHGRAAQVLRHRIDSLGGQAADTAGAWGLWAQSVQGTANLLSDILALKSLKEGEEGRLKDYQGTIEDVDMSTASVIRSEIIPRQQRHIDMLNQLIDTAGQA